VPFAVAEEVGEPLFRGASLVGITDLPHREIIRRHAVGLTVKHCLRYLPRLTIVVCLFDYIDSIGQRGSEGRKIRFRRHKDEGAFPVRMRSKRQN
jgi:hypothetical protein